MAKKFPVLPSHPERICWGCDRYCPAQDMACGNGTERTAHPSELLGEDWLEVGLGAGNEAERERWQLVPPRPMLAPEE